MNLLHRRRFLSQSAAAAAAFGLSGQLIHNLPAEDKQPLFKISLAEWSLHKTLFDEETRQPRLRQDGQRGIRHRRGRVRQPVLQGQGPGQEVPGRDEEAGRGSRRGQPADHDRRRRPPGRSRRGQAARRRSRTTTSGSKPPSSSAAIRFASTPLRPESMNSNSNWPPTACAA